MVVNRCCCCCCCCCVHVEKKSLDIRTQSKEISNYSLDAANSTNPKNNPFNIIKSSVRWLGELAGFFTDKFESFETLEKGIRAGLLNLKNGYKNKGVNTPAAIVKKYAPISDNSEQSQKNYIGHIAYIVHGNKYLTEKRIVDPLDWVKCAYAIMKFETGKELITLNQLKSINTNEKIFI